MAATGTPTPNIGLRCPQGTDPASVDDINYNSGVIDTKLGAVGNTSVQAQIDALNSKLENKIPTPLRLDRKAENTNSWTFHVPRYSRNSYSYFLLVGGTSISQGFLYHGFVHVGGNDAVGLTLIGGTAVAGITGAYNESNETLTITTTNTNYGGMRLIWLS